MSYSAQFGNYAGKLKRAGNALVIVEGAYDTFDRTVNHGEKVTTVVADEALETIGTLGGAAAGAKAGAAAGLLCGPGAWACSPLFAAVGAVGGGYVGGKVGGDVIRRDNEVSWVGKNATLAGEGALDVLDVPYSVPYGRGY